MESFVHPVDEPVEDGPAAAILLSFPHCFSQTDGDREPRPDLGEQAKPEGTGREGE